MYFAVQPAKSFLTDANAALIECFSHVRASPTSVGSWILYHAMQNSKRHYYSVRREYNRSRSTPAQAARFIYLNRTSFNGVFRVNLKGGYNVPYGYKRHPSFPSRRALALVALALRPAELATLPFDVVLDAPERGDFVYADPPYPPLSNTANFAHYTMDRFGEDSQRQLADSISRLSSRGVLVMATNADTPLIRRLYRGFRLHRLEVTRFVSCKSVRHRVGELVITNYEDGQ